MAVISNKAHSETKHSQEMDIESRSRSSISEMDTDEYYKRSQKRTIIENITYFFEERTTGFGVFFIATLCLTVIMIVLGCGVATHKSHNEYLNSEIERLKLDITNMEADHKTEIENFNNDATKIKELEESNTMLVTKTTTQESELESLQGELVKKMKDIEEEEKSRKELSKRNDKLQEDTIKELQTKHDKLQARADKVDLVQIEKKALKKLFRERFTKKIEADKAKIEADKAVKEWMRKKITKKLEDYFQPNNVDTDSKEPVETSSWNWFWKRNRDKSQNTNQVIESIEEKKSEDLNKNKSNNELTDKKDKDNKETDKSPKENPVTKKKSYNQQINEHRLMDHELV